MGVPVEFQKPVDSLNPQIAWVLGSDKLSNHILARSGFTLNQSDLEVAQQVCARQDETMLAIHSLRGRTVILDGSSNSFLGQDFSSLEISGFGYQSMRVLEGNFAGLEDKPIEIPSTENFVNIFPSVTSTSVVDDSGIRVLPHKYSFKGAYTEEQAVFKVAANLAILGELVNDSSAGFLVPIPIAIGKYPNIKHFPDGNACFVVWKVPYNGSRQSFFQYGRGQAFDPSEYLGKIVNNSPIIGKALAWLHAYGLTHNQMVTGNFHVENEELPPLLADFSTIYPMSRKKEVEARCSELYKLIIDPFNILMNLKDPDALTFLFYKTMYYYGLQIRPGIQVRDERSLSQLLTAIVTEGINAKALKQKDYNSGSRSLWSKIQDLTKAIKI